MTEYLPGVHGHHPQSWYLHHRTPLGAPSTWAQWAALPKFPESFHVWSPPLAMDVQTDTSFAQCSRAWQRLGQRMKMSSSSFPFFFFLKYVKNLRLESAVTLNTQMSDIGLRSPKGEPLDWVSHFLFYLSCIVSPNFFSFASKIVCPTLDSEEKRRTLVHSEEKEGMR